MSMSTEDLLRPSGWLLRAATDLSHVLARDAVARTSHDATTLDLLLRLRFAPEGRKRAVDLCEELHKSPSHLSRVVDRAEASGLVRRMPDPDDRRAHLIAATPAGEAAVAEFLPHLEKVLQRTIYASLNNSEIETLISLLARISDSTRLISS